MTVDNFVRKMDCNAWHSIEKFSYKHPTVAKISSLPISLAIFVKTIVATPAKFIEECVLMGKSIRAYKKEKDKMLFSWRKRNILNHSLYALKYATKTVLCPFGAVINAIVSLAAMVWAPLKTAKMNAANKEFRILLKDQQYVSRKTYENGELRDFASEVEFARAAFNRFKKQIASAKSSAQLNDVHFIDDEVSKAQLIAEIALKKQKFLKSRAVYEGLVASENKVPEEQKAKLVAEWKDFQKHLINATQEEASEIKFTPSQAPAE